MADYALATQQLTWRSEARIAVNAVDLQARTGERYMLVGPPGAGKTTLLSLLNTTRPPASGIAQIAGLQLGRENDAIRARVGTVYTDSLLDARLTVAENLRLRAAFYGMRRAAARTATTEAAAAAGVSDWLHVRYGRLPAAPRRLADLARALLHRPALLLLDDPLRDLSKDAADTVARRLDTLAVDTGVAVLETSRACDRLIGADRIGMMIAGRLFMEAPPDVWIDRYAADRLRLLPRADAASRTALLRLLDAEGYAYSTRPAADGAVIEVVVANSMGALLLTNRVVPWITRFEMLRGDLTAACQRALREAAAGAPHVREVAL